MARCELMAAEAERLRLQTTTCASGARLIDCGIQATGGLEAGRGLAEICMANLGNVNLLPDQANLATGLCVSVSTDQPVLACMAAQYAGWQLSTSDYFAMGSGPMRAAAGREDVFEKIGYQEQTDCAVGVLESSQLPPPELCVDVAAACRVDPKWLTLLVAPTSSQAGNVQIVARSVETALHKLLELGFDLSRIISGHGVAPLPPVAADDLTGLGRTNDAVLYGAQVTLWVKGDDRSLEEIGPQVPSCHSRDYGEPFSKIFEKYERDFYKIDPLLFSPAAITMVNLDTGRTMHFGRICHEVLQHSFQT